MTISYGTWVGTLAASHAAGLPSARSGGCGRGPGPPVLGESCCGWPDAMPVRLSAGGAGWLSQAPFILSSPMTNAVQQKQADLGSVGVGGGRPAGTHADAAVGGLGAVGADGCAGSGGSAGRSGGVLV